MTYDAAGRSIDEILDHGAPGLRYWEHFLPLYEEVFPSRPNSALSALRAAYDEQRGADLAGLDDARNRLAQALSDAECQWSAQWALAQRLPAFWSGGTGDQAQSTLIAQLRRAREDLDVARSAVTALGDLPAPLRQAALTKAESALALLESAGGGEPRVAVAGRSLVEIAALEDSDPWLTSTFKPEVEEKLEAFTRTCRTTDQAFESHYATVISALDAVLDLPFPQPFAVWSEQSPADPARLGTSPDAMAGGSKYGLPDDRSGPERSAEGRQGGPDSPGSGFTDSGAGPGAPPATNPDLRSAPASQYDDAQTRPATTLDACPQPPGPMTAPAATCPDAANPNAAQQAQPNAAQPQCAQSNPARLHCAPSGTASAPGQPSTLNAPSNREPDGEPGHSRPESSTDPEAPGAPATQLAEAAATFLTTLTEAVGTLATTVLPEALSALTDLLPTPGEFLGEPSDPNPIPSDPADPAPTPGAPADNSPAPGGLDQPPEPPPAEAQPPAADNNPSPGDPRPPESCANPPRAPESPVAAADPAPRSPASPDASFPGPAPAEIPPSCPAPPTDAKDDTAPPGKHDPGPPSAACEEVPPPVHPDPGVAQNECGPGSPASSCPGDGSPEAPSPPSAGKPDCEAAPPPNEAHPDPAPNQLPDRPAPPELEVLPLGPDGLPPPSAAPPPEPAPPPNNPAEPPPAAPPGAEIPDGGTEIPDTVEP
ncbi:hypothetical protein [Nocardia sp. NPDC057668]|uniref:hypothetical protein n=1 Tax=Nocardia sp. NPDC057668 TaxID=3346202 RepID=UPI003670B8CC